MELIADLEEKRQLLDELEARIDARSWIISKRALNVLFYAAQMEVFDAFRETRLADVASWLGVSKPTARKAFDELVAEGLLVKVSQRPPVFRMTDLGKTLLGLEAGK